MELRERLRLIKERHRELILRRRKQLEAELGTLYEWDEEPDLVDDSVLAREVRREFEDDDN